jgi:predicted AAA+ superfamily ATPase
MEPIKLIQRPLYMERIRPFIDTDLVKVLTGIRRCGKSFMLELIQRELLTRGIGQERIFSFNFEDLRNAPLCSSQALYDLLQSKMAPLKEKAYLFLDEIQEVAEWERCVNSLRLSYNVDIYITGSNAALLSGELATYLAGRYVELMILPFSFEEFIELYRTVYPEVSVSGAFKQYLALGGMPFLRNLGFQEEPARQYLTDLYQSVVLKDIISRNHIRDVDMLERIILYIIAHIGQPFSATSISAYFKSERRTVAPETILNYIRACENAFLLYRLRREDIAAHSALPAGKKILRVNEKYYLADHGLREALYGSGRDINVILENIVYLELLRQGYAVTVGRLYDKEIDFIGEKRGERIYIQTAYLLASPETEAREFEPLKCIRDNYPKYVLTLDEIDMSRNGIRHFHIRDFLLGSR